MIPALVGTIGGIYSVGKGIDSLRYWNDYRKNTGYSPRYPFRAGQFDFVSDFGHSAFSFYALKNLNGVSSVPRLSKWQTYGRSVQRRL